MAGTSKGYDASSSSWMSTVAMVCGAHVIMMLSDGTTSGFGIFLTDFADELNVGLGVIGAVSSSLTSVLHFCSPFGVYVASKIGYRRTAVIGTLMIAIGLMMSSQVQEIWQLFITHSAITGLGVSLVFSNTISFVGMTCDRHISIANGVTVAGTAMGWITVPLLITALRERYGWRGSMLLLGAIVLHATMLSLIVFRNSKTSNERNVEYSKANLDDTFTEIKVNKEIKNGSDIQKSTKEVLKEYIRLPITYPLFSFLIIVGNIVGIAFSGTFYHIAACAIRGGLSESKAAFLMTIYGIGNIISRMTHGIPIKLKLVTTSNIFIAALVGCGVSTIAFPFCKTFEAQASVTLCLGLTIGACIPLLYLSTREIVGVQNFPKAMGMGMFTAGFTGVFGGFFAGWIYDISGSYNTAFFVMGSFFFIGVLFLILPRWWLKRKNKGSKYSDIKPNPDVIGDITGATSL